MDARKALRPWVALLLILTLLVGMVPAAAADKVSDAKEKLDALQEEKDAIDEKIEQL